MTRTKLSHGLLGGTALAGLLLAAAPAAAFEYSFGETSVQIDTIVSAGLGMRTHPQDCLKISVVNGGCATSWGQSANINTDDGDINFEEWDIYSAPVKAVSDIEVTHGNYGAFFRVKAFYDYIGDQEAGENNTRFGRRPLADSLRGDDAVNGAGRV